MATPAKSPDAQLTEPQLNAMLRAVADPVRRRILALLKQPGCCAIGKNSGMCACDIESQIELSQPTISHHMAVLRKAGLVEAEKVEQWMWYRRNERALRMLAHALREQV
ncbi:MAG TPA: metalloregulator ArsR/SmtB family transcription factor [Terriglobales bacterium]|nr:metalloregulator ArsR/SmtB family transcription factor [Terriglobales bacterium]